MSTGYRYRYFRGGKDAAMARIRDLLVREPHVLLAVIFGSFVELESYRDIDIAIYSLKRDLDYYLGLGARLELELGIPIDIVPIDEVPPRFRFEILRRGVVVVEKIPGLYEALLSQAVDELELMELLARAG